MAVRLSPELIFAKVAAGLGSEFIFEDDKIILKSPESEKVCLHVSGWFKKTKTEYRLKQIVGRFNWDSSKETFFFKVYGKEHLKWGENFAGNISSALGKDVMLCLGDTKLYENCPGDHLRWF